MTKWMVVQITEERPELTDNENSLCLPIVADVEQATGDELLNLIETDAYEQGKQVQQFLFTHHIKRLDVTISGQRTHDKAVACQVVFDGKDPLTFITRFGAVRIPIQQAHCQAHNQDFTPLNRILPSHQGCLTTPGVQELSCLFAALCPSYELGNQLLAIALQEPKLLSTSKSECLVETHGRAWRKQELTEANEVLKATAKTDIPSLPLQSAPAPRRSTLGDELLEQVRQKLANVELEEPAAGLSKLDWKRIVTMAQANLANEETDWFAELGPTLRPGEVVLLLDGILVKGRPKGSKIEECCARIATPEGFLYISGPGQEFQLKVQAALKQLTTHPAIAKLTVIADGARTIRTFYAAELKDWVCVTELILDWYHLQKKCHQLLSMVCHGRQERAQVEDQLYPLLWQGDVDTAGQLLETLRSKARHVDKLDELLGYLDKHRTEIPNYDQRRANCQFNGAGMVEKENDLLVARRQKHRGMQWIAKGADFICALRTLWFNGLWASFWKSNLTTSFAMAG
jgi:hypothetical protein